MSKSKKVKHYLAGQRYWEVFVIDKEETVGHACELMDKNRIGALIVVDKKTDVEPTPFPFILDACKLIEIAIISKPFISQIN